MARLGPGSDPDDPAGRLGLLSFPPRPAGADRGLCAQRASRRPDAAADLLHRHHRRDRHLRDPEYRVGRSSRIMAEAYKIIDHTYDAVVVGAGGSGLRATMGIAE